MTTNSQLERDLALAEAENGRLLRLIEAEREFHRDEVTALKQQIEAAQPSEQVAAAVAETLSYNDATVRALQAELASVYEWGNGLIAAAEQGNEYVGELETELIEARQGISDCRYAIETLTDALASNDEAYAADKARVLGRLEDERDSHRATKRYLTEVLAERDAAESTRAVLEASIVNRFVADATAACEVA